MKVRVKLYGILSKNFPGYKSSQGIEVKLLDGATVNDLLAHLEISKSQRAVAIAEGRILKAGDEIPEGVPVNVVQSLGGG